MSLCACNSKSKEVEKIDLSSVNELTTLKGFQLYNDSLDLHVTNENINVLKELTYREAKRDVITKTNRLIILKVDFNFEQVKKKDSCDVIIQFGHHYLNSVTAYAQLTNDSLYKLNLDTVFNPYNSNNFNFRLIGNPSKIKHAYFLMKHQSHSAYANIVLMDYSHYIEQVPKKNLLAGSLLGAYIILIVAFFFIAYFYDLYGIKAIAIYSVCSLLLILVDTGWLRSFIRSGPESILWLDEFSGYFTRYLNVFSGIYVSISILRRFYFGKKIVRVGLLIGGLTLVFGIIHYLLAIQKPYPNNSIYFFTNSLYLLLLIACLYVQLVFTYLAIRKRELWYKILAIIFTLHTIAVTYLILHDLNIFGGNLNNSLFLSITGRFPVFIYLPILFDWIILLEVTILILSVFYIVNQNIELHSKVKDAYRNLKQESISKVFEIERAERVHFGDLLQNGVVNRVDVLNESISALNLNRENKRSFDDLFQKLTFQMDYLIYNNEDSSTPFKVRIESFINDIRITLREIKITTNIDEGINEFSREIKDHLVSILKEAVNNSIKHSGADKINITMEIKDKKLVVNINDNGSGFQRRKLKEKGNGLVNMENRVNVLGGDWHISSKISQGTTIHIIIPLEENE